jgi:hypothetical protein
MPIEDMQIPLPDEHDSLGLHIAPVVQHTCGNPSQIEDLLVFETENARNKSPEIGFHDPIRRSIPGDPICADYLMVWFSSISAYFNSGVSGIGACPMVQPPSTARFWPVM